MIDRNPRLGKRAQSIAKRISELSGWPALITPGIACWRVTNPNSWDYGPLLARECRVLHCNSIIGFDVHHNGKWVEFATAEQAAEFLLTCPSRQFVRRKDG